MAIELIHYVQRDKENIGNLLRLIEEKIGHCFKNKSLLVQALCHRSYAKEFIRECSTTHEDLSAPSTLPSLNKSQIDNERLEFLGDSILNFCVTKQLFAQYPELPEGKLSKIRSYTVSRAQLAQVAKEINLEDFLLIGKSELSNIEGEDKKFIMESQFYPNAVESLIGALYLDNGIQTAQRFIHNYFTAAMQVARMHPMQSDPKTYLQEYAWKKFQSHPEYELLEESGPDHNKLYKVSVAFGNQQYTGSGKGLKSASIEAAKHALRSLLPKYSDDVDSDLERIYHD